MKNIRSFPLLILLIAYVLTQPLSTHATIPLSTLKNLPDSTAVKEIRNLINNALTDSAQFVEFHNQALELLDANDSPDRNETLLIPVLEASANNEWLNEADRMRDAWRLKSALKNRPGQSFPEFNFMTPESRIASIRQATAGKTAIILFYDPDCTHCMEEASRLATLSMPREWTVVALDMATPSDETPRWPDFPKNWIKGTPTEDLEDNGMFDFRLSPSIFLISPDSEILLKDTDVSKIDSLTQQKF